MNPLDLCTDPQAMAALLQRSLPGFADGPARIEALRVHKVRRSSSIARQPNPITLCCELEVRDRYCRGSLGLYAKMFRDGASAKCFASIDRAQLERPAWGEALVHLPALDMVLWALPNDPGLPQLTAMLDPVQLHPLLPWAALGVDPLRARGLDAELLRHEPEQRATLRCTIELDGAAQPVVVYAKTFADSRGRAIDERFDHFWRRAQDDATAPLVARPLGWDERTRTVWQASASGTPLREVLKRHGVDAVARLAQVAGALAHVHAAPLTASREHPIAHGVAEARRRRTKIARAEPALGGRVHALVDRLEAQATQLPPRALSLIHGDFHHDQVWLHDGPPPGRPKAGQPPRGAANEVSVGARGRVVLFDFDEFALGDPMEDVAAFATRLDDEGHGRAFIEACAAQPGIGFDRPTLAWHLALQALLQASRAFVFQRPGWRVEQGRWLARAEAHAAGPAPACSLPAEAQRPGDGPAREEPFA